ncbi:CVNH domain-containing protein [Achaetomium macrosporum]|uniref:CVNH domain-containing protein n=1 Tax=Achaetomium macrosporum TaxID=79813 RepID=A0AAN7C0S3_9PEZI|nr:CVNH domain-containing protein [Achaetomium macrosporum]
MAAHISITCRNLVLDPATDVLSGECNDGQGDHAAFQKTSLDLNTCLVYDITQARILWRKGGNFGAQCKGCSLFWTKDPIWGGQLLNLECTCAGADTTFDIDSSYIDNKFGTLVCSS